MIRHGHLGIYEMTALVTLTIFSRMYLNFPQAIIREGTTAGWLIPLGSAVLCLPTIWVISGLATRFPGQDFIPISERVLGPVGGIIIGLLISAVSLTATAITVREFNEVFITIALPHTPISVLTLILIAITTYVSYNGLESLGRLALLLSPWIGLAMALIFLSPMSFAETDYLFPLLGPGLPRLFWYSLLRTGAFLTIILIAAFLSAFRTPRDVLLTGAVGVTLSGILMAATTLVIIAVTSYPGASILPFPAYYVVRQIYLGRFFQRVEAVFVVVWFTSAVMTLSFAFHASVVTLAQTFKLPFYQPLCFPLGILTFVLSLTPKSLMQTIQLDSNTLRNFAGLYLLLPILVWGVAVLRKEGTTS